MLAKKFPKGHYKAGIHTFFKFKFEKGSKIHTIRRNYSLWKKRAEQVNSGEAYISVREWSGKPYRSPQNEIAKIYNVVVEQVKFEDGNPVLIENNQQKNMLKIATNDGLDLDEFRSWFKGANGTYALIHFGEQGYKVVL